jgi:hypothetical protein
VHPKFDLTSIARDAELADGPQQIRVRLVLSVDLDVRARYLDVEVFHHFLEEGLKECLSDWLLESPAGQLATNSKILVTSDCKLEALRTHRGD